MKRVLSLFVLGVFAVNTFGCGGTSEIPTAKDTPKPDPEKMKAEMQKSFEMGKPKGQDPSAKPQ